MDKVKASELLWYIAQNDSTGIHGIALEQIGADGEVTRFTVELDVRTRTINNELSKAIKMFIGMLEKL